MTPYEQVLVTVGKKNLLLTETNLQHNQAREEAAICHSRVVYKHPVSEKRCMKKYSITLTTLSQLQRD